MKRTKATQAPAMTIEERFTMTAPRFQSQINTLAAHWAQDPLKVYAAWRNYCSDCSSFDQSPLLSEFQSWKRPAGVSEIDLDADIRMVV